MKTYHFKKIILFSILLGSSQVSWAACTQTLSPGANLATAISSAAAGSTICLNSGNYGNMTLSNISKSSAVTLQSASGVGATIGIQLGSSNQLTFQNLKISVLNWTNNKNTNIKVLNNTFVGQMYVNGNGSGTPQNNVIDGNTFDGIDVGSLSNEGRLQLYDANDLIISNNHFGRATGSNYGGDSDGIQAGGHGGKIGPGNVFDGVLATGSGRHVDAIQLYGQANNFEVYDNYFINGGSYLFNYSETVAQNYGTSIHDNVFVIGDYYPAVQNAANTVTFKHNTMIGVGVNIDGNSTNAVAQDNIFTKGGSFNLVCTGCTISKNMFDSSGNADGTNTMIGSPQFVGGTVPTTLAGYQLTSSSMGYQAATDGKDMGKNFFGAGAGATPAPALVSAPSNLRVN